MRRRAYMEKKQREARRRQIWTVAAAAGICALIILFIILVIHAVSSRRSAHASNTEDAGVSTTAPTDQRAEHPALSAPTYTTATPPEKDHRPPKPVVHRPAMAKNVTVLGDTIDSANAALISLEDNTILAHKGGNERIYPASMTKIMTLLVAYEQLENLEETFTVTSGIIDPLYLAEASLAGFSPGETVTVRDLLYGTVLPSGAEAAVSLAILTAGSEEDFVALMNEKAKEMGLTHTHFTNCSGLHDKDHYSSCTEIAMILAYAMQYDVCREILSTYRYTTEPTNKHPEGVSMVSTMFSRMYGDEADGVTVIAGKTGYTHQAGQCLASYATADGTDLAYILVTAGAEGKFEPIFDALDIYSDYVPKPETNETPIG